jgi:hypothetical protein
MSRAPAATVPTTSLARTGFDITRVGLGAWAIGGSGPVPRPSRQGDAAA